MTVGHVVVRKTQPTFKLAPTGCCSKNMCSLKASHEEEGIYEDICGWTSNGHLDILGSLPLMEWESLFWECKTISQSGWRQWHLQTHKIKTTPEAFVAHFITKFGAPMSINTDQDSNFEAKMFKETGQLLGVKKTCTIAYQPQSNGLVKRSVQSQP